jgi:hypothetical protein
MSMMTRMKKSEKWLSPAPVVAVDVHLILPGLREHHDGQVYRED